MIKMIVGMEIAILLPEVTAPFSQKYIVPALQWL